MTVRSFLPLVLWSAACAEAKPPTYHADVAPLLAAQCVGCHTQGGVAPMALDSYESASRFAGQIAAATRARTMPPFMPDGSGQCNTYREARWLSEEEIEVFAAWNNAGAPAGEPAPAPPPRSYEGLGGDVRSLDTGFDYQPRRDVSDDYRCFLVDSPAQEETYFVTGFDVHPGNARIAHHVIVFHPRDDDEVAAARALDAADPAPGYACYGAAGVKAAAVAAWAPGGGPTRFPPDTGVQLRGKRPLIIQMHYHTHGEDLGSDRSRIELAVQLQGVAPGRFLPLADPSLMLAPGSANERSEISLRVADYTAVRTNFRIRGVFPHMHTLGSTLRVEVAHNDGSRSCVVDVPRWDFNWQGLYFYEGGGIAVRPDEVLTLRCTYDTRSRRDTVRWGEGTEDEMCVAGLFVTLD